MDNIFEEARDEIVGHLEVHNHIGAQKKQSVCPLPGANPCSDDNIFRTLFPDQSYFFLDRFDEIDA